MKLTTPPPVGHVQVELKDADGYLLFFGRTVRT